MISNERHWPSAIPLQRNAYRDPNYNDHYDYHRNYSAPRANTSAPRPFTPENSLHTQRIQIERKSFLVMLKENARGRFLRITEDLGARSNSIIIPAEGFHDFQKLLGQMTQAASEIPARTAAGNPVPAPLAPQP